MSTIIWEHPSLRVELAIPPDGPVVLRSLSGGPADRPAAVPGQPLVELLVAGSGRARASQRFSDTTLGRRLRYLEHDATYDGYWHGLRVALHDRDSALGVDVHFRSAHGIGALQSWAVVTNHGTAPVTLLAVTSFAAVFPGPLDGLELLWADSEWLGETRWRRAPLRTAGPADLSLPLHGQHGRGRFAQTSGGTWSTGERLPAGVLTGPDGTAWLWQIEHNGAWHWEVGERLDGVYVALLGPQDGDHQWSEVLEPGASFTTVPVSVAAAADGLDAAAAVMTAHRRALRPPAADLPLPVVFNDYMNTLMGDPTTAKLEPLIDAAAAAGAEVFCIDAGWYDDGGDWWDSVGEWLPSQGRFPGGLGEVIGRIRGHGMIAGLWLEPEVIGVRSPMAEKLPPAAFLQRRGVRVAEHGRYHLDLRHPAAVAHLDEVVDRLVEEFGVGYFKLDYNINPGVGTDLDASSAGAGLLGHNRAHLAWLDRLRARHPAVHLENCASGGMRADYAMLTRLHLQSTSDQQDPLRYPPIAVAAPMTILPEQSASWAYPQPEMSAEAIAFTLCTGLLGRLYLSGNLHRMSAAQHAAVTDAVRVHQSIRDDLASAVPSWPLGLPGWTDPWLSLALRTDRVTYLGLWRRPPAGTGVELALPDLAGAELDVDCLFPRHLPAWATDWDAASGILTVHSRGDEPAARLLRIRPIREDI